MDDQDSLVLRRSRRSTAGNRMEAALAEMATLQAEAEADDDKDFLVPADEEEVFDSDFQSTDDEPGQDDEAMAEREVIAEEKQFLKARRRTLRTIGARSTVLRSSSKASVIVGPAERRRPKKKVGSVPLRGLAAAGLAVAKRKSQRHSTVLSSQIMHLRLKEAEERRAAMPKRPKESSVTYTQAELLARALDTEEGNIMSHRNYLEEEEEKRKRARVVKGKLTGPVLSWISRLEDETVPTGPLSLVVSNTNVARSSHLGNSTSSDACGHSTLQPHGSAPLPSSYFVPPAALQALTQNQIQAQMAQTKEVNKNYLLHKVDEDLPRPDWSETMTAVFGRHADWKEVKVYSGKHRPLSRPVQKCPITGQTAIYRDPRSGIPFSTVDAFKVLSRLLMHEYVWNDEIRCYTADEKALQLEPECDNAVDDVLSVDMA